MMPLYKDQYLRSIKTNHEDEIIYTHYEKCSKCKDSCCESCPCELSPTDLKMVSGRDIVKLIQSGYVTVDYVDFNEYDPITDKEGNIIYDNKVYILRMRSVNDKHPFLNESWGGRCVALGPDGCEIDFHHRPYYARMEDCETEVTESSKFRAAREWYEYKQDMKNALNLAATIMTQDEIVSMVDTILR